MEKLITTNVIKLIFIAIIISKKKIINYLTG